MSLMVVVLELLVKGEVYIRSRVSVGGGTGDGDTTVVFSAALTYPPDTVEIVRVGAVASVVKEMDSAAPCAQAPFW